VDNANKRIEETAKENPAKALELLLKVAEYVVPKLRTSTLDINGPEIIFADLFKTI
jgi:hypothetical protein